MIRIDHRAFVLLTCAILLIGPAAHGRPTDTASTAGGVPVGPAAAAVAARDSSAAAGDTAQVLRIEETGIRFGAGELREPIGLAADPRGYVYVADAMAGKVFRYGAEGGAALEFARPPDVPSSYPIDVAVQESFVFVLDYAWNRLLRYDYKGAYYDVLVSFADRGRQRPVSITAGSGGRLVTTDVEANAVVLWTPLLEIELVMGGFGTAPGSFGAPHKAAFLPDQGIVVVESGNARLQLFSPSGGFERIVAGTPDRIFSMPRNVSADGRGTVFVCDPGAKRLSVFSPDLEHLCDVDSFAGERIVPAAASPSWDGRLYVADLASRSIIVYRLVYPEGP